MEVRPEVTELDPTNGLNSDGLQVTAFSQRYVETAVEMQAGQTFAIAGLLQSRTEASTSATPFFGELPYIGAMFRRVREQRNEIELLITVTPELVDAMDAYQVPQGGPGLNSMSPNDKELYLKGHIEVPNLLGQDGDCGESSMDSAPSDNRPLVTTTAVAKSLARSLTPRGFRQTPLCQPKLASSSVKASPSPHLLSKNSAA